MRELARSLSGFNGYFSSRISGVRFSAKIFGNVQGNLVGMKDLEDLILAVRITLRSAASDLCEECDPCDLSAAEDFCNRQLRVSRPIGGHELNCTGRVSLFLGKDDKVALRSFMSAQREQALRDQMEIQHISAMYRIFTHPGSLLAWWLEQRSHDVKLLPKSEELNILAALFAAHPAESREPLDRQLLDILKAFVSGFPELHQKRMLITLMASAFRRSGQPHLAERVESLI